MTDEDKTLLELAAKAAGLKNYRYCPAEDGLHACIEYDDEDDCTVVWMPHLDNGDALRLAVRLGMNVYASSGVVVAEIIHDGDYASTVAKEPWKGMDGKEAATRRAIVRAAAEIGKAMQ